MFNDNEENKKNNELSTDENGQAIDGEILQNEEEDEEELTKEEKEENIADVLAIISLICILIPNVVTMSIGIILLVFTRIKYPNNKFSKVALGIGGMLMFVWIIITFIMFMTCVKEGITCINMCSEMDCEFWINFCEDFPD